MGTVARRTFLALVGVGALGAAGATTLHLSDPYRPARPFSAGRLTTADGMPGTYRFGSHEVRLDATGFAVLRGRGVSQGRTQGTQQREDRSVWSADGPFLLGARGTLDAADTLGHFVLDQDVGTVLSDQHVRSVEVDGDRCALAGTFGAERWQLVLRSDGENLHVSANVPGADVVVLRAALRPEEGVHGLGEQFTEFNLRGRSVPVITREQGIGRGAEPLTTLAELTNGAGGSPTTTYAPIPFAALDGRALAVHSDRVQVWDTRSETLEVRHWGSSFGATWYTADSPAGLLSAHAADTGRMSPLPSWTGDGAILGLQDGTQAVREKLAALSGSALSAVWLQDWVGRRTTSFGDRLWWNWELDRVRYPGWEELVSQLHGDGLRVLGYVNCFLADPAGKPDPPARNLFAEAQELGYLVRHPDGGTYLLDQDGFDAALVDLTHPQAREWFVQMIVEQLAGVGFDGWMADFGEGLPLDAVLHGDDEHGADPALWHNRWPTAWAEVNTEAVRRAGLDEAFVFHRSGGRGAAAVTGAFWAGDQLTTFDVHDGLASALRGLLAGGISGMTLNHSDTGGYTGLQQPVVGVRRERELLLRWAELNAWTPVLRTHEGNQPDRFAQVWDEDVRQPFAEQTRIVAALAAYRGQVVAEAARAGLPAMRHGWLAHPGTAVAQADEQFFFGERLLIAPVLYAGHTEVEATLPPGEWVHLWSGAVHDGDQRVRVAAPLGRPGVFYRRRDAAAGEVAERVRSVLNR